MTALVGQRNRKRSPTICRSRPQTLTGLAPSSIQFVRVLFLFIDSMKGVFLLDRESWPLGVRVRGIRFYATLKRTKRKRQINIDDCQFTGLDLRKILTLFYLYLQTVSMAISLKSLRGMGEIRKQQKFVITIIHRQIVYKIIERWRKADLRPSLYFIVIILSPPYKPWVLFADRSYFWTASQT